MKTFTIFRYEQTTDYTTGILVTDEGYLCDTLERPWLGNNPIVSSIPEGEYQISRYISPQRHEMCILVRNVPGRTGIEIHEANQVSELEGCIAVGTKSLEILLHSREKLAKLLEILGTDIGTLIIKRI